MTEYEKMLGAKDRISQIINTFDFPLNVQINLKNNSNNFNMLVEESGIPSSTAIGFLMEEFFIQKFMHYDENFIRSESSTKHCYDIKHQNIDPNGILNSFETLINIKMQKKKKYNNAIAAFNSIENDYKELSDKSKSLFILKFIYEIDASKNLIKIEENDFSVFAIEESNFIEIKKDSRSWSDKKTNEISGRVVMSKKWRADNKRVDINSFEKETFYNELMNEKKRIIKIENDKLKK